MQWKWYPDPMERRIAEALTHRGIRFDTDHPSHLDFYLPDRGIFIEVKQFHSPRAIEQLSREKNVILAQGAEAVAYLADLIRERGI